MSSPPIAVAGCIHDTYPMMATCTPIQTRTTAAAVNALVRAIRERTKQHGGAGSHGSEHRRPAARGRHRGL